MATSPRPAVVAQLEQEWPLLRRGDLAVALARWRTCQPSLRRFQRAEDLLGFLHAAQPDESDGPLLALLVLAADDRDAGRFVLQAILPGLKAHARRLATRRTPREELWELLLFYAWEAICTYPVQRRRRHVAANLVLDVLRTTILELDRAQWPSPAPLPRQGDDPRTPVRRRSRRLQPRATPRRAVVRAAVRAGVISRRDAAIIVRTRIDAVPLQTLADKSRVPYVALLKRRQRAERALRDWARVQADVRNRHAKVLTSSGRTHLRAAPERTTTSLRTGTALTEPMGGF